MTTVITTDEVFEFLGLKSDMRVRNERMISEMIDRKTVELEETIGRKITSTSFTNVLFQHGLNCEIYNQQLFLRGIYQDIYSITSIYENGVLLTAVTDYNDSGDYYHDKDTGILHRKWRNWSNESYGIKISGSCGIVVPSTGITKKNIKDLLIEIVAAKSGLWTTNVQTEGGDITTIRTTISKDSKALMQRLISTGV